MNRCVQEDLEGICDLITELSDTMKTLAIDLRSEVENILRFGR